MVDPRHHSDNRGWIESILRYIPGFRGYLEKEYRRESDALLRNGLADALQRGARPLDEYARRLADEAKLDALPQVDRLRNGLTKAMGRLRGQMHGYSGFFDFVQVDEAKLDQVYDHDMALNRDVESLVQALEALPSEAGDPARVVPPLLEHLQAIEKRLDAREDLLKGLK